MIILLLRTQPVITSQSHQIAQLLCLDIGLVTTNVLLELQELSGELDLGLEEVLSVQVVGRGITAVLLDVEADGGARGTRAGKADDDAAT